MSERTRDALRRGLVITLFLAVSLGLLRLALAPDSFPGGSRGEAWGRLFVTAQVGRWIRGEAPWLSADLAGWPTPISFWPVDPLVQAVSVPLSALLGDTGALTAVTVLLVAATGIGAYVLSRTLGAGRAQAVAAGLACQLAPFMLRNLADLVLEIEAMGPLALAVAALVSASRAPDARRLALAGVAIAALAATSPYYVIYLTLGAAVAALSQPSRWRTSLKLAAVGALACGLVLLPMALAEGGASGRLGPQYQGRGYHPSPGALVHANGRPWREALPPTPVAETGEETPLDDPGGGVKGAKPGQAPPPGGPTAATPAPLWKRQLARFPGGAVALIGAVIGLLSRDGRRWALLGLAFFLGSPAPYRLAAMAGWPTGEAVGLIQELLARLPLTNTMGNPMRALAPFLLLAFCSASLTLSPRRAWLALALPALAVFEATIHLPRLGVPATRAPDLEQTLQALTGPTIVFPSGDPPVWHPSVYPKEALFLAGRAGVPVAYDYGRGRTPADLGAQLFLARVADTPIGDSALHQAGRSAGADPWGDPPFENLLVLESRLTEDQRAALRAWLQEHMTLLHEQVGASAWRLPRHSE